LNSFFEARREGELPPLLLLLVKKLGGEVVITDEEMENIQRGRYVLDCWYEPAKMQTMYRLRVEPEVVDGEVVEDVVPERLSITDGN
jgi:hypothetical protein